MDQTKSTEQGRYVLLRADNLRMLMPQNEIGEIEHLDQQPVAGEVPGFLTMPDDEEACYLALSGTLKLQNFCPDDRFVSTRITTDDGMETLWCWSEARVLLDFQPEIHDIPAILLNSASPLTQYTLMDEQPVYLCSARILQQLLLMGVC